jgi:RNA recognition motif-containing protein
LHTISHKLQEDGEGEEAAEVDAEGAPQKPRARRGRRGRGAVNGTKSDEPVELSETVIFVGNLPWKVKDEDLKDIFKEYNVKTAHVVMNTRFNRSKGFGFVELQSHADQTAVLNELSGVKVEDRDLVIKAAKKTQEVKSPGAEGEDEQ